jgi:MFS transporter, AAHS family, 4-hydroxybenzoate transporter
VAGSLAGGTMLAMGLTMPALFLLAGAPAIVAGASMMALGLARSKALPFGDVPVLTEPRSVT